MRITQSNAEKLVIVHYPYLTGGICLVGSLGFLWRLITHLQVATTSSKDLWIDISGFSLLAVAGFLLVKRAVFTFDLRLQQLTWSRRALLKGTKGQLPLSRISAVDLETTTDNDGYNLLYRVTLTTTDGVIPLTSYYSSGEEGHRAVRDAIAEALRLPIRPAVLGLYDEDADPTTTADADIREMVAQGQIIAAIKAVRARRDCSLMEARDIVANLQRQTKG